MTYHPRLPEHNSNVSREHPLREFLVLVTGLLVLVSLVLFVSGLLVDRAVRYIDPELEAELFAIAHTPGSASRSDQERSLQGLLDELAQCAGVSVPIRLEVSESEDVNAFALPGGRVVVLSAMLKELRSENALAFVLAHELGHFKNRDHLRGMGRSLVFLAFSVLVTGANSDLSAFLTPAFGVGMASHSRGRESDADATALAALQCHYGHIGGATDFFRKLAADEDNRGWGPLHYFASHPDVQTRIDDLTRLAREMGYRDSEQRSLLHPASVMSSPTVGPERNGIGEPQP